MTSRSIMEIGDSIMAMGLILETEMRASRQRDFDGGSCDEGCGLCGNHPEVICWFHLGARAEWPRRMAG